jgi:predicted lipoprotein with Yx(FWY)xxD motif
MKAAHLLALAAVPVVVASCGSSSNSNSSPSATGPPAAGSTAATAGGGYGSSAASTPAAASAGAPATVMVKSSKLGKILADSNGKTLYEFLADRGATSSCSGACAAAWPPLLSSGAAHAGPGALAADLGTIKRADGTTQVTYRGHPLYRFANDKDSGDAYGEGVKAFGADWYALSAKGTKVETKGA